jgi:hypothetical protein
MTSFLSKKLLSFLYKLTIQSQRKIFYFILYHKYCKERKTIVIDFLPHIQKEEEEILKSEMTIRLRNQDQNKTYSSLSPSKKNYGFKIK